MSPEHSPERQHDPTPDSAPLMERTPSSDISTDHPRDPADAPVHSFRRLSIKRPASGDDAEAGLSEKYRKLDAYNDRARADKNGGAKPSRATLSAAIIVGMITLSLGLAAAGEGASGGVLIVMIVIAVMGGLKLIVAAGLLNEGADVTRTQAYYHLAAAIAWAVVGAVALVVYYSSDLSASSGNYRRWVPVSSPHTTESSPSEYEGGSSSEGSSGGKKSGEKSYDAGEKAADLTKEMMEANLVVAAGIFAILSSVVSFVQFFSSLSALGKSRRST